ncbi:MAG TPA: flavin reductase family protein, partial [Acidimicrobiia bacterium]|nr:flavin reductase family protein [Acidimicrobiia bacterium]
MADATVGGDRAAGIDEARFRLVMGHWLTGVTVITAMDGDEPVGLAANSFTSVSLDPPLVLFCAGTTSSTWPRIESAGAFAVNVLAADQEEVSRLFATKDADRFSGVAWRRGLMGSPILDDALAYLDCTIESTHDAGDHILVVGRVLDLDVQREDNPLVFYRGGYA